MITHEQFTKGMYGNRKFKTSVVNRVPENLCLLTSASFEITEMHDEDYCKVRVIYQVYGDRYTDEDDNDVCVPRHIEVYDRECALLLIYNHNGRLPTTIVSVNYPNECDRQTRNSLEHGTKGITP